MKKYELRPLSSLEALLAVSLLGTGLIAVPGCAGSGKHTPSVSAPATQESGRAFFTVHWPASSVSRLIPSAANSIVVRVTKTDGTALSEQQMARPAGGGTTTASFADLPVGDVIVKISAYPNTNGTGVAQASASTSATIEGGKTTPLSLTLDSAIYRLEVAPSPLTLLAGQSAFLVVTAKNLAGEIVLTDSGKITFASDNSSVATVDIAGKVTAGGAAAAATVTVTETESGKSALVSVIVTTPPTPSPSPSPTATPTPLPTVSKQSVSYQIDAVHSGRATFGQTLQFPATPTWRVNVGTAPLSYPLIANGKVYVIGSGGLYCLDSATGNPLWGPVASGFRALTYDRGKVFVLSLGGTLQAVDAVTGQLGWSVQLPGQYDFDATPTALNGTVYAGGAGTGGTVYAVDETNGAIRWTRSVINGDQSAPAVTSDGVFVAYPCNSYKLDPASGAVLWHYESGCSGGGGRTEAVVNGRVYDRENSKIFNAATGAQISSLTADRIPALNSRIGCFLSSRTLRGIDVTTGSQLWSFAGNGQLNSAPLLIDDTVIIGADDGTVFALNAATGLEIWRGSAGAPLPSPDEQNVSQSLTGFAAGEGFLIVPADNTLTAWRIASGQ